MNERKSLVLVSINSTSTFLKIRPGTSSSTNSDRYIVDSNRLGIDSQVDPRNVLEIIHRVRLRVVRSSASACVNEDHKVWVTCRKMSLRVACKDGCSYLLLSRLLGRDLTTNARADISVVCRVLSQDAKVVEARVAQAYPRKSVGEEGAC